MKKTLVFALATCFAAPALATNFSYTNVDVSLGVLRLDQSLNYAGEIYDEFGTFALSGAFQVNRNFVLGVGVSVFANDGPATEISGSAVQLSAAFPFAVAEQLDIVPSIGLVSAEIEHCVHSLCEKDDDSGVIYSLGLRAWAVPNTVEVMAGVADSTLDGSETVVSIGTAFWWLQRHSLRLNYSAAQDADEISLGYRFSW